VTWSSTPFKGTGSTVEVCGELVFVTDGAATYVGVQNLAGEASSALGHTAETGTTTLRIMRGRRLRGIGSGRLETSRAGDALRIL